MADPHVSLFEQRGWNQWQRTLVENLERETGRAIEEWGRIARESGIPSTELRRLLRWLKETHGLGQNRGYAVMWFAYPELHSAHQDTGALLDALFKSFPAQREQYLALEDRLVALGEDVQISIQKTQVTAVRHFKFAQVKPARKGLLLGLHLGKSPTDLPPRWGPGIAGDRISAQIHLAADEPLDVLLPLLQRAYALSGKPGQ